MDGKKLGRTFLSSARSFGKKAKKIYAYRFYEEDCEAFLRSKNIAASFVPSPAAGEPTPVQIKHAIVAGLTAIGIFSTETQVMRATRALMDRDGAAFSALLDGYFSPTERAEIAAWMDLPSGAEYAGGYAHRLTHGHDLEALAQIFSEHGLTGAAEWFNQVVARDFWTPHGVPYLPGGSEAVYDGLVNIGISPSQALDVLTINAAEVLGSGLLLFTAIRLKSGLTNALAAQKVRRMCRTMHSLMDRGRPDNALDIAHRVETVASVDSAHFKVGLFAAGVCMRRSAPNWRQWGELANRILNRFCVPISSLPELDYECTRVATSGLALIGILSVHDAQGRKNAGYTNYRAIINTTIDQLEANGKRYDPFRNIASRVKSNFRFRPFSAAANYRLALELIALTGQKGSSKPRALKRNLQRVYKRLSEENPSHANSFSMLAMNLDRRLPCV